MNKITKNQLIKIDKWMQKNARSYDKAKWDYLYNNGSKDNIVIEMLKYQNEDGGFGNGFESDMLLPLSNAISSAEAIFQAYEYDLDCNTDWFTRLLNYFEKSVQSIPKFWEDAPKEIMNYDRAPWWNYEVNTQFSPNPCAIVASALILYGTESQKGLGYTIAKE